MDEILSHEEIIILNNKSSSKICTFEVNFQKTIKFDQFSEIALIEISLPESIRSDVFNIERKFTLNLLWITRYFDKDLPEEEWDDFLKNHQIDKNYDQWEMLKEIINLEPKKYTVQMLTDLLKNSNLSVIQNLFKHRFENFDFDANKDMISINYPSLTHENGYFVNKPGQILIQKKSGQNQMKPIAHIFYNFDPELHNILGFDPNLFPCFQLSHFQDNTTRLQRKGDNIRALFKVKEFGKLDNIFVYTDVVKETYVGNIKTNILRVFGSKESTEDMITYAFYNPIFIPLRLQEINNIKIEICDSFGVVPSYVKGEINLVLMIRPIENR